MTEYSRQSPRISRIGTLMSRLTTALMMLTPVIFGVLIYTSGVAPLLPLPQHASVSFNNVSAGGLAAAIALAALHPAVFMLALWLLRGLFELYRQGLVFDARNVRFIRQIGWTLVAVDVVDFLSRLGVGPLLAEIGASEPFLHVGIGLSMSIVGAFVIVIAHVMELGRELNEFETLAV